MINLFEKILSVQNPESICELDVGLESGIMLHVWWKDRHGKYLGSNDVMAKNGGIDPETLKGLNDFDLCWKDSAAKFRENDHLVMTTEKSYAFAEYGVHMDGIDRSFISYKTPLRVRTNRVIGSVGVALIASMDPTTATAPIKACVKYLINNCVVRFTLREAECINETLKGLSAKQIADVMQISVRTVEDYLSKIKQKVRCDTKTLLVKSALNARPLLES